MTIDWWTLGFQTVNVVVLVWLLQHFFWRPVAAMIELRRDATSQALAEAETTKDKATAALADIEMTRAGFAKERDTILAAAHDAAEQASAGRLAEADRDVAALRSAATAALETEKQAAEISWTGYASRLAVDIANRLAERLDGSAVRSAFLDWLIKAIATLPEAERTGVTELEAVSAAALDTTEQKRVGGLIAEAFGGHPTVFFRTDPALISGLELHGPHLLVSNSWRADLRQILADITHEK